MLAVAPNAPGRCRQSRLHGRPLSSIQVAIWEFQTKCTCKILPAGHNCQWIKSPNMQPALLADHHDLKKLGVQLNIHARENQAARPTYSEGEYFKSKDSHCLMSLMSIVLWSHFLATCQWNPRASCQLWSVGVLHPVVFQLPPYNKKRSQMYGERNASHTAGMNLKGLCSDSHQATSFQKGNLLEHARGKWSAEFSNAGEIWCSWLVWDPAIAFDTWDSGISKPNG